MNSKDLGADVVFSWPGAQIGIMAARQRSASSTAASLPRPRILKRRVRISPELRRGKLRPRNAAATGYIDELIAPRDTRKRLVLGLQVARGKHGMTHADGAVLLTGATGFVGMELLARYLERTRPTGASRSSAADDDERRARERIDAVLANLFGASRGMVFGARDRGRGRPDRAAPRHVPPADRDRLAAESTMIVHCAASVSFDLPLEEARAINVEGTRRMLELAEPSAGARCASTATPRFRPRTWRAPTWAGSAESDLDFGQSFHNSYEQSKFESEQPRALAYRTFRSRSCARASSSAIATAAGPSAFNVLYWPLRALARGLFAAMPAIRVGAGRRRLDRLRRRCASTSCASAAGATGETYHLTAGAEAHHDRRDRAARQPAISSRPLPELLSPAEFMPAVHGVPARRRSRKRASYFPYFSVGDERSTTRSRGHTSSRRGSSSRRCAELHGPPARLRDLESVGQAPDRSGRRGGRRSPSPTAPAPAASETTRPAPAS